MDVRARPPSVRRELVAGARVTSYPTALAAALLLGALPGHAESALSLRFPDPVGTFRGIVHDREGRPILCFDGPDPAQLEAAWPDGAIWPREFQRPDLFLHKGHITSWDYYPEFIEGPTMMER